MKALNLITLALLIVGGVNWGLVAMGGHEMDLVANIFGGDESAGARVIYALVGLSALWQILPWSKALRMGEDHAEAGHTHSHVAR
ncbi:DUF378 domain-containing protein [Phenylobacterium deserti]|uniref:DUF378 domain-containing protein n=1 Tax=Phenylobacterium deserti TaxID=1914756 RepID=A0A328A8H0_9CAUL|nr:DUF378 domain-containing protein [Phenylobacterium deserti]RAK50923.1 DUF378 domain-containing protein [Phenylobacterium deserti]